MGRGCCHRGRGGVGGGFGPRGAFGPRGRGCAGRRARAASTPSPAAEPPSTLAGPDMQQPIAYGPARRQTMRTASPPPAYTATAMPAAAEKAAGQGGFVVSNPYDRRHDAFVAASQQQQHHHADRGFGGRVKDAMRAATQAWRRPQPTVAARDKDEASSTSAVAAFEGPGFALGGKPE